MIQATLASLFGNPPLPTVPSLAITSCDSFEGLTLALCLANRLEYKFKMCRKHLGTKGPANPQLLCLARDPTKCNGLNKNPFCKVVKISYDQPDTISIALRGVQTPQRVDWADRMIDAMKNENVVRCVAISSIGTDAPEKDQLDRFRRVEDRIKKDIPRWTILREGFPFQALFYWIPMVQNQGVLGMPIKPEIEFAPLDIADLCRALISVTIPKKPRGFRLRHRGGDHHDDRDGIQKVFSNLKLHATSGQAPARPTTRDAGPSDGGGIDQHDGQIYTLTGPETVTGPKLADELTRALRSGKDKDVDKDEDDDEDEDEDRGHKGKKPDPIVFKELTREEFRNYLLTLRNKDSDPVLSPPVTANTEIQPVSIFMQFFERMTGTVKSVSHGQQMSASTVVPEGNDDDDAAFIDPPSDEELDGEKPPKRGHGPALGAPNDTEIDLIMELLDYINEGRATFQSGDLEKITGVRGNDAKTFFKQNGSDFRLRPDGRSTAIGDDLSVSEATGSTPKDPTSAPAVPTAALSEGQQRA
ncbi:hypothetical protein BGW39_005956 [Mortierella sp. 14UC]|nr:hypothetical protein BGW39_005956 [Mortierella sp. 14UC]